MNTDIKVRCKLLLSVLALALAAGLGLAMFGNMSPPVSAHSVSIAHAYVDVLTDDVQFENVFGGETTQEEPEKTIGPAIALGMLAVGAAFGAFTIYRCRKDGTDNENERQAL